MVHKLREALVAAGETPVFCAWFRAVDAASIGQDIDRVDDAVHARIAAATPSGFHSSPRELRLDRIDLGTHVAVDVTDSRVSIWADRSPRVLGRLLSTYRSGAFRATMAVYDDRVDLTIEDDSNGPLYLIGQWTSERDECLVTARAVQAMARVGD